jgi:hypothetical protein
MDIPFIDDSLNWVPVPKFRWESILRQQNLEWMIVKHNHSVEECPRLWTMAYGKCPFSRIKERLFREENYEQYIGRAQRLEPNLPSTCNINLTSDEGEQGEIGEKGEIVIYDSLMYVLKGTGLIWVVALSQPQIHRNALCICFLIGDDTKRRDLNFKPTTKY